MAPSTKVKEALAKLKSSKSVKTPVTTAAMISNEVPEFIFSYDTETTNLITEYSTPSDDPVHPHLVQLAAVLFNTRTGEIADSMDVIIKPDGWVSCPEALETHGITEEYALEHGIPEQEAVEMFIKMRGDSLRVAYNSNFDKRIMRIATKRYLSKAESDKWHEKEDHVCSMQMARKDMKVKSVKLVDAFAHYMGRPMEGNHEAMADTMACLDVYMAIKGKQNALSQ